MPDERWVEHCERYGLPDDAGILLEAQNMVVSDWKRSGSRELWHYLNHARGRLANLKMRRDRSSGCILWVSKRAILKDEQLMFDYGMPLASWS